MAAFGERGLPMSAQKRSGREERRGDSPEVRRAELKGAGVLFLIQPFSCRDVAGWEGEAAAVLGSGCREAAFWGFGC